MSFCTVTYVMIGAVFFGIRAATRILWKSKTNYVMIGVKCLVVHVPVNLHHSLLIVLILHSRTLAYEFQLHAISSISAGTHMAAGRNGRRCCIQHFHKVIGVMVHTIKHAQKPIR